MKISDTKQSPLALDFKFEDFRVISGGQNGADQAGLRAARSLNIPTGGWSTKGWRTLDGPKKELLSGFGLRECEKEAYPVRTELNAKDSDATIRFAEDINSSGERCTKKALVKHKKPYIDFHVPDDLTDENAVKLANHIARMEWLTINIAGNSEKTAPGIGEKVEEFLKLVFAYLKENH